MKPAREPASSRPKPCASLKKPHESCPFAAPCGPRRKKNDRCQTSVFQPPGSRLRFSRTGIQPYPGSSTIELPSTFVESGAYPSDRPNREGSQLAASLEGEPGPIPAGKTLPRSYPETRFRRERARGYR